jgi:hypothetical protein
MYALIQIVYDKVVNNAFRAVLSMIVNIDNGVFTSITLDNADCSLCDVGNTQKCINNQCFDDIKSSSFIITDPSIYISWIGTDANGQHCLSYAKRLSRFTEYSIGSIYNSAKKLV